MEGLHVSEACGPSHACWVAGAVIGAGWTVAWAAGADMRAGEMWPRVAGAAMPVVRACWGDAWGCGGVPCPACLRSASSSMKWRRASAAFAPSCGKDLLRVNWSGLETLMPSALCQQTEKQHWIRAAAGSLPHVLKRPSCMHGTLECHDWEWHLECMRRWHKM